MDKLTPDLEALISAYQQKWRKIALSTKPIDRQKAAEAAKAAYALIGEEEPEIIFFDSPYPALIEIDKGYNQLKYDDLLPRVREHLHIKPYFPKDLNSPGTELFDIVQNIHRLVSIELQERMYEEDKGIYVCDGLEPGNMRPDILCYEGSWLDFCIAELNFETDQSWEIYQALLKHCGWICDYEEICIICDRPRILCFDSQHRLHAESAPAIQYADGFSVYAYHGVRLPEKYGKLHPQAWHSEWLLSEKNAELRRVLIQGIGYPRICEELQATELDTWQEYVLLRIDTNVDVETIYLLKMTCPSTGYTHAIRVPPDVRMAREAIRWVNWDIDPENFAVQT